jgi:RNA-directed DNA polymerase
MSLKDDKQQNIQMELDFSSALTGEAREVGREGTESSGAANGTENPASTNRLMEAVCERENLKAALKQVKANKGSPGVDGMTVAGIKDYLKQHWPAIREQLLNGTYEPKPVRRVEIPKPDGGVRKLGIPTVSADCTRAQFAFGMDGDPSSVPSASRPALSGLEGTPNRRY